jgi:hypothetical protein
MRKVFRTALALGLALGFGGLLNTEAEAKSVRGLGTVAGSVRDHNGLPVSGVLISLIREGAGNVIKQTRSTADGSFSARIAPGRYSLKAFAAGFNEVLFSSVQVRPSDEIIYRFNLEPTGSGRTTVEQRRDRDDVKWRLRSAHDQRSIFQAGESENGELANASDVAEAGEAGTASEPAGVEDKRRNRTRGVVETYFNTGTSYAAGYSGVNFAFDSPAGDRVELIFAGQTGIGAGAPQRLQTAARVRANDRHVLNLSAGAVRLPSETSFSSAAGKRPLGQFSVRAIDEWIVRDGVVVVLGLDYSRFLGAGGATSISPRIGLQFDANARTRVRAAYAPGGSDMAVSAVTFEEGEIAFKQPETQPVLFVDGQAVMERSRRFEIGIERVLDNESSVEATAFFDTTTGRGLGLLSTPISAFSGDSGATMMTVANQEGAARGMRVVYARRISSVWSASAGYSFGRGQRLSANGITNPADLFDNGFFQTAALQLDAGLPTGTNVRTVFRFSPEATVFAIDPFAGRLAVYDPSLSIQVTQDLPTFGLPVRAEAVIDARNLLDVQAQTDNGDTLTQLGFTRRSLRGGISLRF